MPSNWCHTFVPIIVWIQLSIDLQVFVTSCQVYPSEYAYRKDSVEGTEPVSAKCSMYPANERSAQNYIHCNGTQLRLTDSDLGNEQYIAIDHYVWSTGTQTGQFLFTFSSRVIFSTITLHYFKDSLRGLPMLRFFAVSDDFYIWKALSRSNGHIDIAEQGGEPAGQRSISFLFNFTTAKILMYKLGNDPQLAMSEVEFFTSTNVTSNCPDVTSTFMANIHTTSHKHTIPMQSASAETTSASTLHHKAIITRLSSDSGTESSQQSGHNFVIQLSAGVISVLLILAVVILTLIILLLLWNNKRIHKLMTESDTDERDASYSILNRAMEQQTHPQSLNTPAELYSKIRLSPSTGQSEPITKSESKNINIFKSSSPDPHHMQKPTVTNTNSGLLEAENSTLDNPTYAVVNKKKKGKIKESQDKTLDEAIHPEESAETQRPKDQLSQKQEDVYAVVHKKPKKCEEQEDSPPVPSHTIESLYTAVQKKLK